MKTSPRQRRRGLALVVILALIVIATILIVAFTANMRTERQAALSMANDQRAKLLTQNALEHAIAILDSNIPQPVPPGGSTANATNWIVNPGLLTLVAGPNGQTVRQIPLSSNPGAAYTAGADDADLNLRATRKNADGTYNHAILSTNTPMRVAWINMLRDPLAPAGKDNPIVGRYAFWMDDESAKINLNMAYGKPPLAAMNFAKVNPLWQNSISTNDLYGTLNPRVTPHASEPDNPGAAGPPVYNYYADIAVKDASNDPAGASPPAPDPADLYADPPKKITQDLMANAVGTPSASTSQDPRRYFPLWHPTAINLDVLGAPFDATASSAASPSARDKLADWIYNGTKLFGQVGKPNYRLLTSIDQIKQFVPSDSDAFFQKNKFFLTTSSRDPEFNVFGKPRIYLERQYPETFATTSFTQPNPSQPIFFQADFDANGPTYFHGYENFNRYLDSGAPGASAKPFIPNLTGLQHTADAIGDLLNRDDWPGMPARSFVDKWGGGAIGLREADQVAWNIAIMGNYAQLPWGNGSGFDHGWYEGIEPTSNWLLSPVDPARAASTKWPGSGVRTGKLSGKAIIPVVPRPHVNKIVLVITPEPPDAPLTSGTTTVGYPPTYDASQPYRLKVTLQVEFFMPEGYPLVDIKSGITQFWTFTYFDYAVSGLNQNGQSVTVAQTANAYGPAGVKKLIGRLGPNEYSRQTFLATTGSYWKGKIKHYGMKNTVTQIVRPGSYSVVASDLNSFNGLNPRYFYIRGQSSGSNDGTNLSDSLGASPSPGDVLHTETSPAFWAPQGCTAPTYFVGTVNFSGHLRLATGIGGGNNDSPVLQMIPVCDNRDGSPALNIGGQNQDIPFNFSIDLGSLGPAFAGGQSVTRTLQVKDGLLGGSAGQWSMISAPAGQLDGSGPYYGAPNPATNIASLNAEKRTYFDSMNAFYNESPRGSIGMLSVVPTGIQREKSGEFLKFQPSADKSELPDWLLLDLLGPSIWPHTSMNSTLGKVNINATIFPDFGIQRWVPLQGVFQNMPHVGASGAPSLNVNDASTVVKNIINHNLSGQDFGAPGRYDYIGEICEVAGVADTGATDWDKEVLIRNLANILTVRSNTFKVYGVAQTIKKRSTNTNYGEFEPGDIITGEKRFESVVERAVWPGKDGVPGNAHVSAAGTYDSMATQPLPTPTPSPVSVPWVFPSIPKWGNSSGGGLVTAGRWPVTDGPDAPTYSPTTLGGDAAGQWATTQHSSSALEDANNPLRAWMKYRVLSFNYLGDY